MKNFYVLLVIVMMAVASSGFAQSDTTTERNCLASLYCDNPIIPIGFHKFRVEFSNFTTPVVIEFLADGEICSTLATSNSYVFLREYSDCCVHTLELYKVYENGNGTQNFYDISPVHKTVRFCKINGGFLSFDPPQGVCEGENINLENYLSTSLPICNLAFTGPTQVGYNEISVSFKYNGCSYVIYRNFAVYPVPDLGPDVSIYMEDSMHLTDFQCGTYYLDGVPLQGLIVNPRSLGLSLGCHTLVYDYTTPYGCSGIAATTIFIQGGNSLDEDTERLAVVYPNPVNNVLCVEACEGSDYIISNLTGQTVLIGDITAETQQIDMSGLSNGMYFLVVGKTKTVIKLIKN